MKKQIISEEFRRMQKLAGIITENSSIENNPEYKEGEELAQKALQNILEEDENNEENSKIEDIAQVAKDELGVEKKDSEDEIIKKLKELHKNELQNAVIKLLGVAGMSAGLVTGLTPVALMGFTMFMLGRTFQNFKK